MLAIQFFIHTPNKILNMRYTIRYQLNGIELKTITPSIIDRIKNSLSFFSFLLKKCVWSTRNETCSRVSYGTDSEDIDMEVMRL